MEFFDNEWIIRYNNAMRDDRFPVSLLALIAGIAVTNALATAFSWYWRIPWLDMPMHFLGGLWVGSTALWFVFWRKKMAHRYGAAYAVALIAVVVVGGLWEVFEFSIDTLTFSSQNSVVDTASDLFFDILGGGAAATFFNIKRYGSGN